MSLVICSMRSSGTPAVGLLHSWLSLPPLALWQAE
jgi:hypothetical protein